MIKPLACFINKGAGLGVWLRDTIHATTWNPSWRRRLSVEPQSPSCARGASTPTHSIPSMYMWTLWRRCYDCYCVGQLQRSRGCCWETHEPKTIVFNYFLYLDVWLRWIAAPTLLPLLNTSSGNDDLWLSLLASFMGVTIDVVLV
jgi:hypothetical protein